jgi:hypothetical protein
VQDEGDPLGGGEVLEDDQHRHPDVVGELGLLGRVLLRDLADDRLDVLPAVRFLAARLPGAQQVEGDPSDHGGEPGAQVVDLIGVGAAQAQPRLLHRVVGLARGAQHPVGDRVQVLPVLLEALGEQFLIWHVTSSRSHPS